MPHLTAHLHQWKQGHTVYVTQYRITVKLEFPRFSSVEREDPLAFIARCEEYLATNLLSDIEVIPTLSSELEQTI